LVLHHIFTVCQLKMCSVSCCQPTKGDGLAAKVVQAERVRLGVVVGIISLAMQRLPPVILAGIKNNKSIAGNRHQYFAFDGIRSTGICKV
jgi:hypothetical protein